MGDKCELPSIDTHPRAIDQNHIFVGDTCQFCGEQRDVTFTPLTFEDAIPDEEAVHSERNAEDEDETADGDSGGSETDKEKSPNPSDYAPMFGNNLPSSEEE